MYKKHIHKVVFFLSIMLCWSFSVLANQENCGGRGLILSSWVYHNDYKNIEFLPETHEQIRHVTHLILAKAYTKHCSGHSHTIQARQFMHAWCQPHVSVANWGVSEVENFIDDLSHPVYGRRRVMFTAALCSDVMLAQATLMRQCSSKMKIPLPIQPYHNITFNCIDLLQQKMLANCLRSLR